MRVGFLLSHSDQIERFEPLLRRTPGARFLVAPGRWPSVHRDSRAEIIRRLQASGLAPVISPRGEFDLVVAGAECPERSVRAWLRPRGTRVLWRGPEVRELPTAPALTLCAGPACLPAAGEGVGEAVGDPLLDAAQSPGARARARHRLGLGADSERPVVLLHGEAGEHGLEQLAPALASLRSDYQLLVSVTELRRLERRRALPDVLRGPGIHLLPAAFPRAEALALSELVLAEPGLLLLQAAALDRPVLALGSAACSRPLREVRAPLDSALRCVVFVQDPMDLRARVDWLRRSGDDYREETRAGARRVVGTPDGGATRRAILALQLLAARGLHPRGVTSA